jgi:hypothetical protein
LRSRWGYQVRLTLDDLLDVLSPVWAPSREQPLNGELGQLAPAPQGHVERTDHGIPQLIGESLNHPVVH